MNTDLQLLLDSLRAQQLDAGEHLAALEITVYRQQQQLDLLQAQLRKLYEQLHGSGGGAGGAALADDPRADIPPHY